MSLACFEIVGKTVLVLAFPTVGASSGVLGHLGQLLVECQGMAVAVQGESHAVSVRLGTGFWRLGLDWTGALETRFGASLGPGRAGQKSELKSRSYRQWKAPCRKWKTPREIDVYIYIHIVYIYLCIYICIYEGISVPFRAVPFQHFILRNAFWASHSRGSTIATRSGPTHSRA